MAEGFETGGSWEKTPDEEVKKAVAELGIDWGEYSISEFKAGMDVELEHGTKAGKYDVTGDDVVLTAKIAMGHLTEIRDYYTRLGKMESEAKEGEKK